MCDGKYRGRGLQQVLYPQVRTWAPRWTDLDPSHCNGTKRALYRITRCHLGCYCLSRPLLAPGLCAHPVASTSINTTFWHRYDRVQAPKGNLLHSRWSIDVGIESQTPFSPDSLRKTPLQCSPISPERSRIFPIAGHPPGRTTPQSRARRFAHPCSQTPVLSHPDSCKGCFCCQKSSVNSYLTLDIVHCQSKETCACPANFAPAGSLTRLSFSKDYAPWDGRSRGLEARGGQRSTTQTIIALRCSNAPPTLLRLQCETRSQGSHTFPPLPPRPCRQTTPPPPLFITSRGLGPRS